MNLWKTCSCGAVFDGDEKRCPGCGKENTGPAKEISKDELTVFISEKKIWTKSPARVFQ
jgi:hypothetical protein